MCIGQQYFHNKSHQNINNKNNKLLQILIGYHILLPLTASGLNFVRKCYSVDHILEISRTMEQKMVKVKGKESIGMQNS